MTVNWQQVNLGNVVDINPPRQLQRGYDSVYVAMEHIHPNSRSITSYSYRKFTGSGSRFRKYDTLLARITPCLENGKTAFVDFLEDNEIGHGSTEFIILSGKEGISDNFYVYYLARLPAFREFAISLMEGTSGRQRVPANALKRFEFYLPPLPEQKAIAHILGTLDDKIELNQQMNRNLEAIASAIFKSWFIDFDPVRAKMEGRQPAGMNAATAALFPDSFEDSQLGEIPKGWRVVSLPEAIEVNPRRSLPKEEIAPYLDMQNMPVQGHRPNAWIDRPFGSGTKFMNGDTLLARITPCLENGKTAFVDFLEDGQVGWGSTEYIIFRPKPPLPLEYGYYLARSEELRAYAIQNMTGSSGRQRVPAECFQQYPIVIPQDAIARCFGDSTKPLMATSKANSEQSRTLATIRDALLPKLMSGEIRVREAEKILEDVA